MGRDVILVGEKMLFQTHLMSFYRNSLFVPLHGSNVGRDAMAVVGGQGSECAVMCLESLISSGACRGGYEYDIHADGEDMLSGVIGTGGR